MKSAYKTTLSRCAFALLLSLGSAIATSAWAQSTPRKPAGKELVSPGFATQQVKVQYPNKVEALFDLTYSTVTGYRPLTLDLYHVPAAGVKPAIVFVHGGSFVSGSPRNFIQPVFGETDGFMAYVASRGYVVAAVEYRFAFEAKWPAQLQDVKTAVRWLRANASKYGIDPQHIAVWGESAGATMASMAGVTCGFSEFEGEGNLDQSSCIQASVEWYGATDMAQMDAQAPANTQLIHNSPDSSQSRVLGCVLKYQCPVGVVAKANPIAYIDPSDAKVSFLIQHGDDDKAVSWKQGQIFYDALRAKGITAKFDLIPGVDHYFTGANQEQAKQVLDSFFSFLDASLKYDVKK